MINIYVSIYRYTDRYMINTLITTVMDKDIDNKDIEIDTNITSTIIYLGNLFVKQGEICFGWGLNRGKA